MKQLTDIDYVTLYAEALKKDSRIFKQQKMLIDSQLKASASIFGKMFGDKNFNANARKYLKKVGLLKQSMKKD